MRKVSCSPLFAALTALSLIAPPLAAAQTLPWAPAQQAEPPAIPDFSPIDGEFDYALALESAMSRLEQFDPADGDLATSAQTLGTLETVFAFVRDKVRPAPYTGDLRDPEATFAARAGNATDQAELLAEMLIEAGIEARIVSGPLNPGVTLAQPGCAPAPGGDPLLLAHLDGPAQARMHARAQRDFALLNAALPDLAGGPGTPPGSDKAHTWVQARQDGTWIDLDPMRAGATPGDAPGQGSPAGQGPAHMVTLRVQAETLTSGGLTLTDLLTLERPASSLATAKVQLAFTSERAGAGGGIAGAFSSALGEARRIRPLLMIDDETLEGEPFDTPAPPAAARGLASTAADPVTAVWLELETNTPDGTRASARRAIVDLIPRAQRLSGAASAPDIMEPLAGEVLPAGLEGLQTIVVSNGGLDPMTAAAMMMMIVYDLPDIDAELEAGKADGTYAIWQIWADAYAKTVAAEALVAHNTGPLGCAVIAAPRVYLYTTAGGGEDSRTSIDWAIDGVSTLGAPDPGAAAQVRLWHGVVQAAFETALAESKLRIFGGSISSTSILLPGPLTVVAAPPTGAGWMGQADQDAGWLVVSGDRPAQDLAAWWRVDPATGAADARLADLGNHSHWTTRIGGLSGLSHTHNGAWDARTGRFIPNNAGKSPNLGGKTWREVNRGPIGKKLDAFLEKLKQRKAANRQRKLRRYWNKRTGRGGGGGANEYLTILENVSIPVAIAAGSAMGVAIGGAYFYALTGEKP